MPEHVGRNFWERFGMSILVTVVMASASAVGTGAYFEGRHNGDLERIASLQGEVDNLRKVNADLDQRKEDVEKSRDDLFEQLANMQRNDPLKANLDQCNAKLQSVVSNQNSALLSEIQSIEKSVNDDERLLQAGSFIEDPLKGEMKQKSYEDERREKRIESNRADLSVLRSKLTCVG